MTQKNHAALNRNDIAEIKLRAERKAGELLRDMSKNEGGRPTEETGNIVLPVSSPKLSDIGISHNQSSRFQAVAAVRLLCGHTMLPHKKQPPAGKCWS